VQIGLAVKRRVGVFGDEEVVRPVNARLEIVSRLPGFKWRTGVLRIVTNENNGLPGFSPMVKQQSNVVFTIGVVTRAERGEVKSLLDIDNEKCITHAFTVLLSSQN
jgi:hypothetical protein